MRCNCNFGALRPNESWTHCVYDTEIRETNQPKANIIKNTCMFPTNVYIASPRHVVSCDRGFLIHDVTSSLTGNLRPNNSRRKHLTCSSAPPPLSQGHKRGGGRPSWSTCPSGKLVPPPLRDLLVGNKSEQRHDIHHGELGAANEGRSMALSVTLILLTSRQEILHRDHKPLISSGCSTKEVSANKIYF